MTSRVVLVLCLLLSLSARAAPPGVESRFAELETVTVGEHPGPTSGRGLELAFKRLPPEPALARFTVEEARAFVVAMEATCQAPALPSRSPASVRSLACDISGGLGRGTPASTQPSDLERRLRAGYEELFGPSSLPLLSSSRRSSGSPSRGIPPGDL